MIKGGYYIKARQIKFSAITHSPPYVRELWDYLLREAAWEDKKHGSFIIKKGQLFKTYKDIINDLSWKVGYRTERYSKNQMKRAMKYLRDNTMIATMKEPRGVMITVLNYEFYQSPKNYERTTSATTKEPTKEPRATHPLLKKEEERRKNKNSFPENSIEFQLSKLLYSLMQKNNPKAKEPNFQTWAKYIDYMFRLDNRTEQEIREIIEWSQADDFWKSIILSTKKLRAKFDQLWIKAHNKAKDTETNKDSFLKINRDFSDADYSESPFD
jgi:hypothetical protein